MFRYLSEAFWARPRLAGLGRIPWNALAVAGAIVMGFGEHAVWLGGLGLETLYLYAVATNGTFQQWVDSKRVQAISGETESARAQLINHLHPAARQRMQRLLDKIGRVERMYRSLPNDDFIFDSNREALEKLSWLFLKLLVAQRNIQLLGNETTEADLRKAVADLEAALPREANAQIRASKEATLNILRQRLRNFERRAETLAETDADLARIEAQVDLAIEEAGLKGRPTAISANIDLVSQMLDDNYGDASSTIASLDQQYTSPAPPPRATEIEN